MDAGTTLLADTTTAGRSWEVVARAPLRGVVFAETIGLKRDRGLQTDEAAWQWLGSIRPEAQVAAPRTAWPESACTLQHFGLALSQSGCQPVAAVHSPGRDARGTAAAQASGRAIKTVPGRPGRLGRRVGADRSAAGGLCAPRRATQRRLADRPRHVLRAGRILAASPRGGPGRPPRGRRLLPEDSFPLRPRSASVSLFLERGAIVCLGTDSLASSSSLSILDEVRFLHARDDSLSGELLLTMATLFGAWALEPKRRPAA